MPDTDSIENGPVILALDTSSKSTSIAISRGGELILNFGALLDDNRSAGLWRIIDFLLAETGLKIEEIDLFAVCVGPGGFTGLRVGMTATKGFAMAMGKPIVATDADGLLDILTRDHDAVIVPKRDAAALADKIVWAIDRPDERARLGAAARQSGQRYDIDAFVRKMQQLYVLLHDVSRQTARQGVLTSDLSFLHL